MSKPRGGGYRPRKDKAMRSYRDCEKVFIGASDSGFLVLVGVGEDFAKSELLDFGEDGSYMAYIVEQMDGDEVAIPDHYRMVRSFRDWLRVYDDEELVQNFMASKIRVWRAGEMGCIIELDHRTK